MLVQPVKIMAQKIFVMNHNSWYDEDKSEYLTCTDLDSDSCTDSSTAAVAAES